MQVKLDLSLLEDILDDVDFCCRLAKEESVIILPGEEGWVASVELHYGIMVALFVFGERKGSCIAYIKSMNCKRNALILTYNDTTINLMGD